jgi:RHS repeat-associated protein
MSGGAQTKALIATTEFKSLVDSPARPLDSITYTFNNDTKEQFSYQYDKRGRIRGVTAASAGATGYGYDGADRLTSADHPGAQPDENFVGYDHAGNRLGNGAVIGADNRLLEDANFTYDYDAEGNLVAKTDKVSGDVTHYEWDYRSRLTAVWEETAGQVILSYVEYRYDPLDRRVSRTDTLAGTQSVFAWDGENAEAVLDGQGKLGQRFLHGPGVDEVLAVESFDQPAAAGLVGDLRWTLLDHLNTVWGLVTTDGQGVTFLGYDAYGRPLNPNAVPLFGFAGHEWDAATGLYSNRARWYDPVSGRFISQDPIGLEGGLNRYEYALGNPNSYTDPNGQFPWLLLGLVAGGFIAGGVVGGSSIRNDGVHLGWSLRGAAIGAGLALGGYAMAGYGIGALSATAGRLIAQGGMGIISARAIYEGYTSGPPGTGESIIPFWGSARQFGHDLSRGSGWAVLSGLGTALDLVLVGSIYHRLTIIAAEQNIRSGPLQLFRAAKPTSRNSESGYTRMRASIPRLGCRGGVVPSFRSRH